MLQIGGLTPGKRRVGEPKSVREREAALLRQEAKQQLNTTPPVQDFSLDFEKHLTS